MTSVFSWAFFCSFHLLFFPRRLFGLVSLHFLRRTAHIFGLHRAATLLLWKVRVLQLECRLAIWRKCVLHKGNLAVHQGIRGAISGGSSLPLSPSVSFRSEER